MDESIQLLEKVMDVSALRHRVLANNLANADTPRFTRSDVKFNELLTNAIETGDADKIAKVQPEVVQDTDSGYRPDGNNVSLQREMGEIAENSLIYQFSSSAISRKYALLKKAINGR